MAARLFFPVPETKLPLETKPHPNTRYSQTDFRIPNEVERKDLDASGLLYSPEVIQAIQREFATERDNRYSKRILREKLKAYGFSDDILKYAVIKNDNEFYIVYKGETWSKKENRIDPKTNEVKSFLAGKGIDGKVKILQKISTRDWYVAKISHSIPSDSLEVHLLKTLGLCIFEKTYTSRTKGEQHHLIQPFLPDFDCLDAFSTGNRFYANKGRFIKYLLEMAKQVQNLHRLGYLHCDIKPDNFRLNALTDRIQVIDMGFALPITSPAHPKCRGTKTYMAPELLQAAARDAKEFLYSKQIDTYSLGHCFHVLVGHPGTPYGIYAADPSKRAPLDPNFIFYKTLYETVIKPMIHQDPAKRGSIDTCIQALEAMLLQYPLDNSSQEVDIHDFFAATDKAAFLTQCAAFPGVNHVVEKKSLHTPLQHSEFQRALCDAGVHTGHYTRHPIIKAAETNNFPHLTQILGEAAESTKNQLIKSVTQFYIKENNATSLINFILLPTTDIKILIGELTKNLTLLSEVVKHEDAFNKIITQAPHLFSHLNEQNTSLLHSLIENNALPFFQKTIAHLESRNSHEEKRENTINWQVLNNRSETPLLLATKKASPLNWRLVKLLLTREKDQEKRKQAIQAYINCVLESPIKVPLLRSMADDLRSYGYLSLLNIPCILSLDSSLKTMLSKMFTLDKLSAKQSKRNTLFSQEPAPAAPNLIREIWLSIMGRSR